MSSFAPPLRLSVQTVHRPGSRGHRQRACRCVGQNPIVRTTPEFTMPTPIERNPPMPEFESEPKFSSLIVDDERAADRVRHVQPHKGRFNPWWIAAIAAAIIVGAFIYWWRQQAPSAPAIASVPPP